MGLSGRAAGQRSPPLLQPQPDHSTAATTLPAVAELSVGVPEACKTFLLRSHSGTMPSAYPTEQHRIPES